MSKTERATIVVTLLDDKTMSPETLEALRMRVEEVICGEHGKRLVRQLNWATALQWSISQSPRPRGTQQPTQREILADQAKRRKETEAYFAQRGERRRAQQAWATAERRLEDRGIDGPSHTAIREELKKMAAEADDVIAASIEVSGRGLGTDAAVKRIMDRKVAG